MENYEHVVKVNALAKEFLKHKVVSSAEEAYKRAEATIKSGTPDIPKVASATMEHSPVEEMQKEVRALTFGLADTKSGLQSQHEEMRHLKDDLANLQGEIGQLRAAIQALKSAARETRPAAPAREPAHQQEESLESNSPINREAQAQANMQRIIRPKEPEQKPIDISSVFYFGNKK